MLQFIRRNSAAAPRKASLGGFPSTHELRAQAAIAAAEAMRPATPLLVAAALAIMVAAGTMFWMALAAQERCLDLAARV